MRAGAGVRLVTRLVLLGALFLLGVASSASAGPATDQLRVGIERVLKTLADPALQGAERAADRRKALREIDGDQATVRTKILDKTSRELPVEYRMLRGPDGRWVIYDVTIEGVSLVAKLKSPSS